MSLDRFILNEKIACSDFRFDLLKKETNELFVSNVEGFCSQLSSDVFLYVTSIPSVSMKVYVYYFDYYVDIYTFYNQSGLISRNTFNLESVDIALLLAGRNQ